MTSEPQIPVGIPLPKDPITEELCAEATGIIGTPKDVEIAETSEVADDSTPVETSQANDSASVETSQANDSAPVETSQANDSAPVETSQANDSASVETSQANDSTPVETSQANDSATVETNEADKLPGAGETVAPSPFDRVPAELRSALETKGFTQLTSVQEASLDTIQDHRDLRISSQTGSGKTVALGLVMAPEIVNFVKSADFNPRKSQGPNALIIAPTRELAAQVQKELSWLFARVRGVKVECVTGGTSVGQERQRLRQSPRIVVGTPGRLLDHIKTGALDCGGTTQLVMDEADQMLDMGFRDELEAILDTLTAERRTHLISATFPREVLKLAETYQTNPLHVQGTTLGEANADIEHIAHLIHPRDRQAALINILLLAEEQRTLVFVQTRAEASQLAESLSSAGFAAAPLSGDLVQSQRTRTLNAFRSGAITSLIATDVAARGLDVPDVATIVHMSIPQDAAGYTHRSGRTGRAGNKGRCILLAPVAGARRARRMLHDANIEADWCEVPSSSSVRKQLKKRARRRLNKLLEEDSKTTDTELEYATRLLEGKDPAKVVAVLIQRCQPDHPCEPRDVRSQPIPHFDRDGRKGPRRTDRPQGPARRSPADHDRSQGPARRSSADHDRSQGPDRRSPADHDRPRPQGGSRTSEGMTHFSINWGLRNGANPRRILALICRRGDITSRMVGAINMDSFSTTFEIHSSAANGFKSAVRQPDPRDPGLHITQGGNPPAGESHRRPFEKHAKPRSGGYQTRERHGSGGGYQSGDRRGGGYQGGEHRSGSYQNRSKKPPR
jgi:ATP-dependent RNA helicase DeaD